MLTSAVPNIDTLRQRLHNPLPRGGVCGPEQVVSAGWAVDVIDGLHSTASGANSLLGSSAVRCRRALDAPWPDRCVGSEFL